MEKSGKTINRLQKIIKGWLEQPFNALHLRLLLSYLSVMSTVLVIMIVFVYQYFANNLYNKFDRQIATLADAVALPIAISIAVAITVLWLVCINITCTKQQ